jgi:hypothetical protein
MNESWKRRNPPYMPYTVPIRIEPMVECGKDEDWFKVTASWQDDDGLRTFSTSAQGVPAAIELLKVGLLEFGHEIVEAEKRKGNPYV